ncbi:hypothetical protein RZS08_32340, partial [Arthrospira platensis SPKY1]|nr:hypothetical protein [Arthrospira platensis SPKY1]
MNGPAPTTGIIVNVPSYTATGIPDGQGFEFFVRAICGEDDLSLWAGPHIFTIFNPPGCASVEVFDLNLDVLEDVVICEEGNACIDLSANYFQTGATTQYNVESIPYAPPYPFT